MPRLGPPISISSDEKLSIGQSKAAIFITSDNYSDQEDENVNSDGEEEEWVRRPRGLSKSNPTTPRPRSRVRPTRPTVVTATATPASTPYPYDLPSPTTHTAVATIATASPKKSKTKSKAKTKTKVKLKPKPTTERPQIQILTHSRSTPVLRDLAIASGSGVVDDDGADAPSDPPRPRLRLRSRSKPPPGTLLPSLFLDTALSSVSGDERSNASNLTLNTERGRLVRLARELEVLFPDERELLKGVEGRLTGSVVDEHIGNDGGEDRKPPALDVGRKAKKRKRGKRDDEGSGDALTGDRNRATFGVGVTDTNMDASLDPRGREVQDGDALVHVFIDQLSF
jgi:hypothetical protein